MAVNVKLGVDLSGFNSGIREGQGILKGLNAEMKATEAEFKATGNAEQMLTNKTKVLSQQIRVQKGIATEAEKALKAMTDAGVDPANAAYQKLYATMMNATAGMNNAQAELNALGASAQDAAAGADQLTTSVNNIGKKISLDQVIGGIDKISSGLENAAKKAISLGKELWNSIMDTAMLADDIGTQAKMFDMTPEKYQQYKGVFDTIGEITIKEWAATKRKIENAMVDPSTGQIDVLKALGFVQGVDGDNGSLGTVTNLADTWEQVFWDAAAELKKQVENGKISQEMADVYGETLFGKKFSSLKTLIDMGQEAFNAALGKQNVATDEAIEKDAALNDAVIKLKASFEALELQVYSGFAPALTDVATSLDGLLSEILKYLQTKEGQEMLKGLGDSVKELFEGMKNINAQDVVNGFKEAFDNVKNVLNWIVENKDTVVAALEGIFGFWATLTVSEGVLTIVKVINGLKDLMGFGGGAAAATGGGVLAGFNGALASFSSWASVNGGPISDWLVNNSALAGVFHGIETIGEWAQKKSNEIEHNAETFGEDWANNELIKLWTRRDANQDAADRLPEGADWRPSYMKDQQPVQVETEPVAPEGAAQDLSSQIGTVTVPVNLVPANANWLPSYMQGFGSHANGLPFVPYDGYLAQLHKGERVVPAREVQSRSYNSNLYVESMIMNNGTDAAGLASAMAAAQQRTMVGFGS